MEALAAIAIGTGMGKIEAARRTLRKIGAALGNRTNFQGRAAYS